MFSFRWRTSGSRRVANALRTKAAALPKTTQDATYKWAQGVRATLRSKAYPPERPKQRYKRTYKLQKSWRSTRVGSTSVEIANSQPYAKYPVGDARGQSQAWMHKGRWWLAKAAVEEHTPTLRQALIDALGAEFRK